MEILGEGMGMIKELPSHHQHALHGFYKHDGNLKNYVGSMFLEISLRGAGGWHACFQPPGG
jgi:hypothetical protein